MSFNYASLANTAIRTGLALSDSWRQCCFRACTHGVRTHIKWRQRHSGLRLRGGRLPQCRCSRRTRCRLLRVQTTRLFQEHLQVQLQQRAWSVEVVVGERFRVDNAKGSNLLVLVVYTGLSSREKHVFCKIEEGGGRHTMSKDKPRQRGNNTTKSRFTVRTTKKDQDFLEVNPSPQISLRVTVFVIISPSVIHDHS